MYVPYQISMESITVDNTRLKDAIFTAVEAYRNKKQALRQTNLDISKAIKDETNMNIVLRPAPGLNAYTTIPLMDPNNPIYKVRGLGDGSDAKDLLRGLKTIRGGIEWKNGRVNGVYADPKLESEIFIGEHLMSDRKGYTVGEVTAIICHEIGHTFYAYAMVGIGFTSNLAIAAFVSEYTNTTTDREAVFAKWKKDLPKSLDEGKLKNNDVTSVVIEANASELRSVYGTTFYDQSSSEYASDMWATRHGLGMDLVTGLDKLARYNPSPRTLHWMSVIFAIHRLSAMVGAIVAGATGFAIAFFVLGTLVGLMEAYQGEEYDNMTDRFKRIRNDMVQQLQFTSLSKSQQRKMISDIDAIEKTIREQPAEMDNIHKELRLLLTPGGRRDRRVKQQHRMTEDMMNHSLIVDAAKLKLA